MADPDLVAQVVFGLLLNAAEAIGHHGAIRVRTVGTGDGVGVEVIDTGPGISPADAERVFEPFFTTKPTGTGLGLPMAARIVQAHGGAIEVVNNTHSDAERGARFRVRLPIRGPIGMQEQAA